MRASVMPVLFERHGTHSASRFGSTASTRGEFEKEATAGKHPATRITASGAATMAVAAAARFYPGAFRTHHACVRPSCGGAAQRKPRASGAAAAQSSAIIRNA